MKTYDIVQSDIESTIEQLLYDPDFIFGDSQHWRACAPLVELFEASGLPREEWLDVLQDVEFKITPLYTCFVNSDKDQYIHFYVVYGEVETYLNCIDKDDRDDWVCNDDEITDDSLAYYAVPAIQLRFDRASIVKSIAEAVEYAKY